MAAEFELTARRLAAWHMEAARRWKAGYPHAVVRSPIDFHARAALLLVVLGGSRRDRAEARRLQGLMERRDGR
jgi:hypothetical protein